MVAQPLRFFFFFWTPKNANQESLVKFSQAKQYLLGKLTGVENKSCRTKEEIKEILLTECIGGKHTFSQEVEADEESDGDFD